MTKSEVEKIMGPPIRSDFSKNVDEWFYCNTGGSDFSNPYPVDEHLVLFFYNNKLITKKNYTVTVKDTGGIYGSCEKFIKMGNYSVKLKNPIEVGFKLIVFT